MWIARFVASFLLICPFVCGPGYPQILIPGPPPPFAEPVKPPDRWALLIAIDQYEFQPPLVGCVEDSLALAKVLREKAGFTKAIELYDSDATRAEIIRAFRVVADQAGPQDDVFIFFHGRGAISPDAEEADWFAADSHGLNDAIPSDLAQTVLRSIRARHVLLVSTAGFSGRVVEPEGGTADSQLPSRPRTSRSRQVFALNTDPGVSPESASPPNVFARAVIEVLDEGTGLDSFWTSDLTRVLAERFKPSPDQSVLAGTLRNTGDEGGEFPLSLQPAQEGAVVGMVFDGKSGFPIPGLAVSLQGSDRKGRTNAVGGFRLWVPAGFYSGLTFEGDGPGEVTVAPIELQVLPGTEVDVGRIGIDLGKPSPSEPDPLPPTLAPPIVEEKPTATATPPFAAPPGVNEPTLEFEILTLDARGKPRDSHRGKGLRLSEDLGGGICLDLVKIPGGTCLRGSDRQEEGHTANETPREEVSVAPFFLGVCEVTQNQWGAVATLPRVERDLNPDPAYFKGDHLPVEMVSWEDCFEFCLRLSRKTGKPYRLPSETEWEYACRAGSQTPFHFGPTISTEFANYFGSTPYGSGPQGTTSKETLEVGHFPFANAFGLLDMHGNVAEWCADPRHETYEGAPSDGSVWESGGDRFRKTYRGGAWRSFATDLRSAARKGLAATLRYNIIGFRVAMSDTAQDH
jgi:formylglycine-generating enzyme required for sulfatase activity